MSLTATALVRTSPSQDLTRDFLKTLIDTPEGQAPIADSTLKLRIREAIAHLAANTSSEFEGGSMFSKNPSAGFRSSEPTDPAILTLGQRLDEFERPAAIQYLAQILVRLEPENPRSFDVRVNTEPETKISADQFCRQGSAINLSDFEEGQIQAVFFRKKDDPKDTVYCLYAIENVSASQTTLRLGQSRFFSLFSESSGSDESPLEGGAKRSVFLEHLQPNSEHPNFDLMQSHRDLSLDALRSQKLVIGAQIPYFLGIEGVVEQFIVVRPYAKLESTQGSTATKKTCPAFGNGIYRPHIVIPENYDEMPTPPLNRESLKKLLE